MTRAYGDISSLGGQVGLENEVFRKCIELGCAKVNISTMIKHSFIDGFVSYHNNNKNYEPLKPLGAQFERVKNDFAEKIKLFSGQGRIKKT